MEIKRERYLDQLIQFKWDGMVKVITGIRRCGKSYLLNVLFRNFLKEEGVSEDHILFFALDNDKYLKYRNPLELSSFVRGIVEDSNESYYLFVDEIQMSDTVENPYNRDGKKITFYDVLNGLNSLDNLDIYVTGSNSKMLSSDILTEFRGRSDEIRVHPLSFAEYYSAVGGDKRDAFDEYAFYGGMPLVISRPDDTAKMKYLSSLFAEVYLKDIVDRKKIEREDVLSQTVDLLCSSIGSLSNPTKIADTLKTVQHIEVAQNTVKAYIDYLIDSFLFSESKRYDVKGRAYFNYPNKYYCEDVGLRNARIGFRQTEMTHIMENIIYNELIIRGYSVDVGVINTRERNKEGKQISVQREIDFIATKGGRKIYIQSAYAMHTEEKYQIELKPFSLTGDSFPKIVVRHDIGKRFYDDNGVLNVSVIDFLLDSNIL